MRYLVVALAFLVTGAAALLLYVVLFLHQKHTTETLINGLYTADAVVPHTLQADADGSLVTVRTTKRFDTTIWLVKDGVLYPVTVDMIFTKPEQGYTLEKDGSIKEQ